MRNYKYFIVGGGMTAAAAAEGIRNIDPAGSIGVISSDVDPPYDRPPLSKGLWKDKALESIWRKIETFSVSLHLGTSLTQIDTQKKQATDSKNENYSWNKLLLATGCSPRMLPFGRDEIIYYRTASDYRRLHDLAGTKGRFAVIGAGFIGSEIAAALRMHGKEVTLFCPGEGIGDRIFPPDISRYIAAFFNGKGVSVRKHARVSRVVRTAQGVLVTASDGSEVVVDAVVAGIGVEPNVQLAEAAGLATNNGIVVDEFLRTGSPDIYAAGDVAAFPCKPLGKRTRVEHEDNANTMGKCAGKNMAGQQEPYNHLPMFYSDLFELGYEAVGELDSRLEVFIDWKEPFKEGVIYYLEKDRVRGVLLWNVWGQVDPARQLISEPGPIRPADLRGRLK